MTAESPKLRWIGYLLLLVAGMVTFWPSVWFDFVNWDDPAYVLHNDLIKSWSPANLAGVATQTVTRNYAPLTILSLLIDHTIWGLNPCGYHATNVLLHLINGILVMLLVRRLSGNSFVAWVTAALFLVHPVQIETVAWISSRKGLLSATFILAALISRLKADANPKDDAWYTIWLAAALLSKALAVVVPAIVLLYDVWIRRQKFSDAFVRQIIPGVMCLLLLLKTIGSQHSILGGVRGHLEYSLWHIIAIDATIMWQYIGMLFWPTDLCVLYNPPTIGIWKPVAISSLGWTAVAGGIWYYRKRFPLILWGAVTFLVLLLPVLNFFKITTLMNDRYLYLPCIIVFAAAASGLHKLLSAVGGPQSAEVNTVLNALTGSLRWGVGLAAIGGAMLSTSNQLPVWSSPETLWNHAMKQVPELTVVRIQMAHTLHDRGQRREAIRTLQRALLETEPDKLDRKRILTAISTWSGELTSRSALRTSTNAGPSTVQHQ